MSSAIFFGVARKNAKVERPLPMNSLNLFVAQSHDGIDSGRAPRRDVAGHERN